jgi:cytochrome c553
MACHGADGAGKTDGSTPRIAGQHYRVLVKQLIDFRYSKRWDSRMEGMADHHHLPAAQDIADVASYVSNLELLGKRGIGSGEFAAEGNRIFEKQCQSCHGTGAEGTEDGVPRLAGQHYAYVVKQLSDFKARSRTNDAGIHSASPRSISNRSARWLTTLARIGWSSEISNAPPASDPH